MEGNYMLYDKEEELFEKMYELYPEKKKHFSKNEKKIKEYFAKLISKQGEVVIATDAQFFHCYK